MSRTVLHMLWVGRDAVNDSGVLYTVEKKNKMIDNNKKKVAMNDSSKYSGTRKSVTQTDLNLIMQDGDGAVNWIQQILVHLEVSLVRLCVFHCAKKVL